MANEYIVINDDLRTMQIPSSITILGVESDDDVNKIPFQMPKEYCGFDLSTFEARINFVNQAGIGDMYIVDDLTVDGDDPSLMTFTWLVGRNACAYKGNTQFIVCLKKFDDNDNVVQEFNTTVYSLPVLQGLETTEAVIQENPDVIEQILKMLQDAGAVDLNNYYTKAQVNQLKLANPYALTINGTSYDGSSAVDLEIEGGTSQSTEIATGQLVHVTDAVANEAVKSLTLYNSGGTEITSAEIAVTNKNLFRIDLLAQQTVSKGITFEKNSDGSIHATGTSTGTYAAAQAAIDKNAFVVGQTYTISSGKTSGVLYVQLIMNYTDGTTDYLVASNTPYTFTLTKAVSSVTGSVQITASGVTVDEWIYPMIELSDTATSFVNNSYSSMTFSGTTMPVLPDSISNVWSNDDAVTNIVMEYWNDPVMAKVNALEQQFYQTVEHDDQLNTTSEKAVQNKVVTAALMAKLDKPSGGATGQVLTKTATGATWQDASGGSSSDVYVTPQMYGAVADGVTDDTAAINQAIQAGEYIVIPEGTYLTNDTILINKECRFECNGTISYQGTGSAVKITGSIANHTDLYFRNIEAYNGTGIEFYSSYFNSSSDNDRVMYVNLYFDHIKAKDKGIYFHRGNMGTPSTDGYMNEIHIYNGKFGGDVDYGVYADSGNNSAINNIKLINLSLEGAKTGIYLKDNIYRWSFINLRYAEAPTNYHIQTVGVVSDIMWFGTCKLYERYVDFSSGTTGFLVTPMAKNTNYYMARINNGALEYLDPVIDGAVQVGTGVTSADIEYASGNSRLQWSCEGSFTINGTTYTKLMMYIGADGNLGFSGYTGSTWTSLAKGNISGNVALGSNLTAGTLGWTTGNLRYSQTIEGSFTVNGATYSKIMYYVDAEGKNGMSGYNGTSWTSFYTADPSASVVKGNGVDAADISWGSSNSRFSQTIEGTFTIDNVTYTKVMFYIGADGQLGLSGYTGSTWVALTKGSLNNKVSKVTVSGTSVTQALTENTFYVFGEVTDLTVTLATPSDADILNEYHFRFTSGSTATTLTLPSSVTMPSDFAVEASKTYEISIVDGYGVYTAW